ncbi:MAG: hypothetical protein HYU39_07770 [Thaumarchaeota archaeon]|nr:hypothetical protein [Nitrososphaerota archaeon]
MPEKMKSATVYGLSSEGYAIASALASNGIRTTIVDETLQMAMELKAQTVSSHPSLASLVGEETLLGLEPMDRAVAKASTVFFAPRIRKQGEEAMGDINVKLREVAKHISKGSTFVYSLPTRLGGNQDNILLVEKQSGLTVDQDIKYVFAPLQPGSGTPVAVGSTPSGLGEIKALGLKSWGSQPQGSLSSAEVAHFKHVVGKATGLIAELEFAKMYGQTGGSAYSKGSIAVNTFIDELCEYLFDLKAASSSFKTGEPVLYLVTGVLRSVEAYPRILVGRVKDLMKEKALRASRSTLHVVWSADRFEMRGDRLASREGVVERLSEFASDVRASGIEEYASDSHVKASRFQEGRSNIFLTCSKRDADAIGKTVSERRISEAAYIVKANLIVELVEVS